MASLPATHGGLSHRPRTWRPQNCDVQTLRDVFKTDRQACFCPGPEAQARMAATQHESAQPDILLSRSPDAPYIREKVRLGVSATTFADTRSHKTQFTQGGTVDWCRSQIPDRIRTEQTAFFLGDNVN